MKKFLLSLLVTFPVACLAPADAQLFLRRPKAPSPQRVPDLIVQVKTDQDERKRAGAATELREFDAKTYPDVVAVLVDVARSDPSATVRLEALASLANIRPISPAAGQMLEWAAAQDESWKVRWQAKSSLLSYRWAGYQGNPSDPKGNFTPPPMTKEPPLFEVRGTPDPSGVKPSESAGAVTRTSPPKALAQPPKGNAPAGRVVGKQPRTIGVFPPAPVVKRAPTPPPIIVDVPERELEPAPRGELPVAAPPLRAPQPSFRPAGQTPPRPGISNTPTPRSTSPAPTKNDDSGPVLTQPM
jgi:hypothetical protein